MDIDQVPTDPLSLGFKGADHKALADALERAFPDPAKLNQMLTARLDQALNAIAPPYPLSDATFEVVTFYKAKGHLLRLMAAARASQPDNAQLALVAEKFKLATQTQSQPQLEKIVKKTSVPFDVAIWRERLAKRESCVCRIELPTNNGMAYGTGFLVGADLVLTNHHVMAPAIAHRDGKFTPGGLQADPKKVIVRFDYKALEGKPLNPGVEVALAEEWHVDSSPHSIADTQAKPKKDTPTTDELDYALIRLAESVGSEAIPLGKDTDKDAKVARPDRAAGSRLAVRRSADAVHPPAPAGRADGARDGPGIEDGDERQQHARDPPDGHEARFIGLAVLQPVLGSDRAAPRRRSGVPGSAPRRVQRGGADLADRRPPEAPEGDGWTDAEIAPLR